MYRCLLCQRDFEGEGNSVQAENVERVFSVMFSPKRSGEVCLCEECFNKYLECIKEEVHYVA